MTNFLLPPSIDEWLPQRHLARFVVEVIDGLNLSAMSKSNRGTGSASYHPAPLSGVLVYGYATGVFSSRKLERATHNSVAFRFIATNDHPDHDTIATFRRRVLPETEALFVKVLLLAREMGMLTARRQVDFARCSSCMVLFVIGADLQTSHDLSNDEAAFNAAMNAGPEIKEWAKKTLETARIRAVAEIKAECVVARERLIARGDPDLIDDLATLDAYVAGFGENGITSATPAIRYRASSILVRMRRQTRH